MLQKSILLIESEKIAIDWLTSTLGSDFRLIFVPSFRRGLNILAVESIDLLILSHTLPAGNNLEILGKLRAEFPNLPVVLLAEAPNQEYIITAFRLGVRDFFVLPVDEPEFSGRLKQLLGLPGTNSENTNPVTCQTPEKKPQQQEKRRSWFQRLSTVFTDLHRDLPTVVTVSPIPGSSGQATESLASAVMNLAVPETAPDETEPVQPDLVVNFLGRFQVLVKHAEIEEWPGRKTADVLAYLVYHHPRHIHRDVLMDRFWPDASPDSARNCLNVTLHSIRKVFEKIDASCDFISYRHECYFINPEIGLKMDVEDFQHCWKSAQRIERESGIAVALSTYERAAAIYLGDFLGDNFSAAWADLDRENLKEIYMEILNKLSNYYSLDGKPDVAIDLCDLILKKDNCREDVHRRLMRCYFRIGQRDKAIRQFNKCTEILKTELELAPSKTTVQLFEKIRQAP